MEKRNDTFLGTMKQEASQGTTVFLFIYGIEWIIKTIFKTIFGIFKLFIPKSQSQNSLPEAPSNSIEEFDKLLSKLPAGEQLKFKQIAENDPQFRSQALILMKQIGYTKE
jgi:hypothetical protein